MIRKILTQEERDRKDKRNKAILAFVIGIIMLLSTVGYAFFSFQDRDTNEKKQKLTFNNIEFRQTDYGTWSFSYAGKAYETKFNPSETENVSVKISNVINDYYQKPLYIGINSKEDIANEGNYELIKNLQGMILKEQFSCLDEKCIEDYPIKNCSVDNVIIFKEGNMNNSIITQNQKCVTLEFGNNYGEEERATDAFLFEILGI